jgi:hypothetical protein
MKILTLLNTSVISAFGKYSYTAITLPSAADLAREHYRVDAVQSAIGHAATAQHLTRLFHFPVSVNRIEYRQDVGDLALVFKLKQRLQQGRLLTAEEIEMIGYDFGLLIRIE